MRLPVSRALPMAALLLASGYAITVEAQPEPAAAAAPIGPAEDYPVVVGEPYKIADTTWTPVDQLNYDAVGYASVQQEGPSGISGAHKTLPLPSYVEVTSLDTGSTILVRLIERGPMVNDRLVALSSAAAQELGILVGSKAAVRVRRVNPPEVERARLRTGGAALQRMDTPDSLLKVLRRKLSEQDPLTPSPSLSSSALPAQTPAASSAPLKAALKAPPKASTTLGKASVPSASPSTEALKPEAAPFGAVQPAEHKASNAKGTHAVQVASFSTAERAERVAGELGGYVSTAGRYWRVRLGPFKSSGEAAPALEKARAAGYSDARIQRAD
ncbi:SPOR domain-containing protein [Novosphingobium sp. RD2P27]|uniref:SPOR domain-containing protein n=1 Tax=Novosphingobium kalidii TaxID=3230299 RepID=A0ABV2CYN4_9SPHN